MSVLTMPTLSSRSGTQTMLLGVASLPVPAVVGTIRDRTLLRAIPGFSSRSNTV